MTHEHVFRAWSSFPNFFLSIMIQILFAVYSHSLFLYLFFCELKDTSKWGWARGTCVQNQKSGHGSQPPPPRCCWLVSWPGREASCHALKCRHKTRLPPAIKCAEWQLCRRSGRCGPALCTTLLRLLASPLQPCPHTPAGGHCTYSLVLSYQCNA